MKIVVTGATGHIGSYLIRDLGLQFKESEILMIDNMMTQRFASLFNLPKVGKYSFVEGDVRLMDLNSLLKDTDIVIHLAANVGGLFKNMRKKIIISQNFCFKNFWYLIQKIICHIYI